MVDDVFTAGVDTTSSSLRWLFLFVAIHPAVQDQLHQELDAVFPGVEAPSLSKRSQCVYTEAVIMETQRLAGLAPLALPHYVSQEVVVGGYTLPAGAVAVANTWAIMRDERFWGQDAEEFRPTRFLNEDGSLRTKHHAYMPFSIGMQNKKNGWEIVYWRAEY